MQPADNTPLPGVTSTDEYQQQLAAVMMAQAANKPKATEATGKPAEAKPVKVMPVVDEYEPPAHRQPCKPYKQPGPGLALRIARWLNLK